MPSARFSSFRVSSGRKTSAHSATCRTTAGSIRTRKRSPATSSSTSSKPSTPRTAAGSRSSASTHRPPSSAKRASPSTTSTPCASPPTTPAGNPFPPRFWRPRAALPPGPAARRQTARRRPHRPRPRPSRRTLGTTGGPLVPDRRRRACHGGRDWPSRSPAASPTACAHSGPNAPTSCATATEPTTPLRPSDLADDARQLLAERGIATRPTSTTARSTRTRRFGALERATCFSPAPTSAPAAAGSTTPCSPTSCSACTSTPRRGATRPSPKLVR